MPDRQPIVSVITPTYRRLRSTERAIESVLAQSCGDFELIVVDDGSGDATVASLSRIKDPRLVIIPQQQNAGPATARNVGLRRARGQYVAFLDSDDVWLPEKLERQLAFMETHRDSVRMSCTWYRQIDPERGLVNERQMGQRLTYNDFLSGCRCAPGSTLMVEAGLLREVGYLDQRLRRLEDWDWLLRATQKSDVAVMDEALSDIHMRRQGGSLYPHVHAAGEIILSRHAPVAARRNAASLRRLKAAVRHERAAAAYLDGRYSRAVGHLSSAFLVQPVESVVMATRALRRVRADVADQIPVRPLNKGERVATTLLSSAGQV